MGHRRVVQRFEAGLDRFLCGLEVARFAQQPAELHQGAGGDGIAGRQGLVVEAARAFQHPILIVGGKAEAAGLGAEVPQQQFGDLRGPVQPLRRPAVLQAQQQGLEQEGMVVEVGRVSGLARLPGGVQASVAPQVPLQELEAAIRRLHQLGAVERARGTQQAGAHQGIPGSEHLVVDARSWSRPAGLEQFQARPLEQGAQFARRLAEAFGQRAGVLPAMQVPATLEVGRPIQAPARGEGRVVLAQPLFDLFPRPGVVASFLALRVGIECRQEGPLGAAHLPECPVDGEIGRMAGQRTAGGGAQLGQQADELGVVVEHLLEVRDLPACVGGIAEEAAAELVEDAAAAHPFQAVAHHVQRLVVGAALSSGVVPVAQELLQDGRLRKLRRLAEAAVHRVEQAGGLVAQLVERGGVQYLGRAALVVQAGKGLAHARAVGSDCLAVFAEVLGHLLEHLTKGGQPGVGAGREVGAAIERGQCLGVEEHRQRPAAVALGDEGMGGLV